MPVFFEQQIDHDTKLAVWHIAEAEDFFLRHVPLQREITHPHKRLQHLAGRYLLQHLFPDFPLPLIKIADTRKPFLEDEAYHFSISHCSDYAAAIVSRHKRVGVDIEVPTPKVRTIAHKFLHAEEMRWAMENEQEVNRLILLWSCKEAVFKWWSYGEVDFSEMIRLSAFVPAGEGVIDGRFCGRQTHSLQLHYRLFANLCLAWVAK